MRKTLMWGLLVLLLAPVAIPAALAEDGPRRVRGPRCGGTFRDSDACSFRYRGGQLYLGGSVRGAGAPEAATTIRLEARSHVTGKRYVLLSCVTPGAGACAAGGSYETVEHVRKGQRLFCIVEGHGKGEYGCGTWRRR